MPTPILNVVFGVEIGKTAHRRNTVNDGERICNIMPKERIPKFDSTKMINYQLLG